MSQLNYINRSGSTPKLICYTQSKKERNYWDYQKPPNEILPSELNGKGKRHIVNYSSEEINRFRSKHLFPQPNSKRTINPIYAPEDKFTQKYNNYNINSYNDKYYNKNNNDNYDNNYYNYNKSFNHSTTTNYKLFPSKKRSTNYKLYRNNFSIDNNDRNKNLNINYDYDFYEDPFSKKRQLKSGIFNYYKTTTQIVNLPGGIKRNTHDIKDDIFVNDIKPKSKLIHPSFSIKVEEDFKSKVTCLPNSMTKNYKVKILNNYNKNNNYSFNRYKKYDLNQEIKDDKNYHQFKLV